MTQLRSPTDMKPRVEGDIVTFNDGPTMVRVWTNGATPRIAGYYKSPEASMLEGWEPLPLYVTEIHDFIQAAQELTR